MRKLAKPYFITLEGPEGSGKSTQIYNIVRFFENRAESILVTREPGGTPIAEIIRSLLVEDHGEALSPVTELLLYNAARAQHIQAVIRPALAQGQHVLCDRFSDATVVYQSYARGLPRDQVIAVNHWACAELEPSLTFILDLPAELGLQRAQARLQAEASQEGRFEAEALDFHQKIRQGYLDWAQENPERIVVIDAQGSINDVWERMQKVLEAKL